MKAQSKTWPGIGRGTLRPELEIGAFGVCLRAFHHTFLAQSARGLKLMSLLWLEFDG